MHAFKHILAVFCLLLSGFAFAGAPVNINTADVVTLADSLDGIGESKARAIVEYREKNGAFKSADELVNVKGIGLRTVERNRDYIRLSDAKPAPAK